VEVKAKKNLSPQDLKSLRALAEENMLKRYFVVSLEPERRKIDKIVILPYREFLGGLWSGDYR
jgi:hypothetical protein